MLEAIPLCASSDGAKSPTGGANAPASQGSQSAPLSASGGEGQGEVAV